MSVDPAAVGGDRQAQPSASRPSMNNCPAEAQGFSRPISDLEPGELPEGTAFRPLSVVEGVALRDEALLVNVDGERHRADVLDEIPDDAEVQARPTYAVVNEWRDWFDGYRNSHIEYETAEGEVARSKLENSYQPEYGRRYYAKLKDLERGVEREWDDLTTVMLTLSASSENAKGGRRCPADHMREIADGWDTARKALYRVLDGFRWEYARVWEPHKSGYGHLHVAVFVDDRRGELGEEMFRPVMRTYVDRVGPAGSEAHGLDRVGLGDAVSMNREVQNLGTYISEYVGIFGTEPTERPVSEQMFYATCWATQTRRLDFSNGAQDIIAREHFRRETGLRPEDRGGDGFEAWRGGDVSGGESDEGGQWQVRAICTVRGREPTFSDPTAGGTRLTPIDGRTGVDPPPERY